MSVQRPLNQLPLKGLFFLPRGRGAQPLSGSQEWRGGHGVVLPAHALLLSRGVQTHGFLRHIPARLSGVSIDLRARKALRFFFHFNE